MDAQRALLLWLHLVAAATWVGGIIFFAVAGRKLRALGRLEGSNAFRAAARAFRDLSWVAVVVLLATGAAILHVLGLLQDFPWLIWDHEWLRWKLLLVAAMIVVKALHDFVIGPRAATNPGARAWFRAAMVAGWLNLVLGLAVLYAALHIARGAR
jgi:putative copper export protein